MLEQRSFRDVLGRYATGVVLVTAYTPQGPAGMAVNSFTSVSLEPPLVGLCAAHSSTTWPRIRQAGGFAVTILSDRHEHLCRAFSRKGAERFSHSQWVPTRSGHPVARDGLAWLDCRISAVHRAGDHDVVIAEALEGGLAAPGGPLIFHAGRLGPLTAADPAADTLTETRTP